jgi:hypothetical protein
LIGGKKQKNANDTQSASSDEEDQTQTINEV